MRDTIQARVPISMPVCLLILDSEPEPVITRGRFTSEVEHVLHATGRCQARGGHTTNSGLIAPQAEIRGQKYIRHCIHI